MNKANIKSGLYKKLKEENAFWSYDVSHIEQIDDRTLIAKTLVHLDLSEINQLFEVFHFETIKKVWREELAISGEYYHSLNRFFAWWYFNIKDPDRYLKWIETRHINSLAGA